MLIRLVEDAGRQLKGKGTYQGCESCPEAAVSKDIIAEAEAK